MTYFFISGRTLDFNVDLSNLSVIGQKFVSIPEAAETGPPLSPTRKGSSHIDVESNWRRPQASQVCFK